MTTQSLRKKKLTIGLDARFYSAMYCGGLGKYNEELIKHLQIIDKKNNYTIFLLPKTANLCKIHNPNFKKVIVNYPWYSVKEQLFYGLYLNRQKLDLMHFPHLNVPITYRNKFVVTIHDTIMDSFSTKKESTHNVIFHSLIRTAYKQVTKNAIKKAESIITPSKFTAKSIATRYQADPKKIRVIYEGVSTLRNDRQIPKKQKNILYVGSAYPHKNLENLLKSFKIFNRSAIGKSYKLLLVGKIDHYYRKLFHWAQKYNFDKNVTFKGRLKPMDLAMTYTSSSAFVFPSLMEGFGLPPLEALAYDLPVMCSYNSPMPEILKDIPQYFDPNDIGDMASKMQIVTSDKKLRREMISRGQKLCRHYSWRKMANQIKSLYTQTNN